MFFLIKKSSESLKQPNYMLQVVAEQVVASTWLNNPIKAPNSQSADLNNFSMPKK